MRAQEAQDLAATLPGRHRGDGRGTGAGLRQSERELLRLLLRLTRDDTGIVPWPRATKWLAGQTGYSTRSIKRARERLVRLELVEVLHQGSGSDNGSLYRVAVDRIQPVDTVQDHLLPGAVPVHPDEKAVLAEVVGGSRCPPRGVTVSPPGGHGVPPYAQARVLSGFTGSTKNPPNPPPASPAGGICEHGRKACRTCGTTPRQLAKAANAAARAAATAPWCGSERCDPVTRLEDLDGGTVRRCPVCHPKRDPVAAAVGDDQPDRWLAEHLDELPGVSKNQSDREVAG